jgi:hypothetical protein
MIKEICLDFSVGFEAFTAVFIKSSVFWDITPCSQLEVNRRFGGTYRLHFQGWRISRALLSSACFVQVYDDGAHLFLRNAGWLSMDYMALYPGRQIFLSRKLSVTICILKNCQPGSLYSVMRSSKETKSMAGKECFALWHLPYRLLIALHVKRFFTKVLMFKHTSSLWTSFKDIG